MHQELLSAKGLGHVMKVEGSSDLEHVSFAYFLASKVIDAQKGTDLSGTAAGGGFLGDRGGNAPRSCLTGWNLDSGPDFSAQISPAGSI